MKRLLLVALLLSTPLLAGCPKNPPTAVATIADTGGRIEDTAHEIFTAVVTYNKNQNVNPVTHNLLVPTPVVDQIAIAVNRIGHVGLDLNAALLAYNQTKAAGKDPVLERLAVQRLLDAVFSAMGDVQKALPPGVVTQIDELVVTVLKLVNTARAGVGL